MVASIRIILLARVPGVERLQWSTRLGVVLVLFFVAIGVGCSGTTSDPSSDAVDGAESEAVHVSGNKQDAQDRNTNKPSF